MKLYHRTYKAKEIFTEGFKDSTRGYFTAQLWTGVWFSADFPLTPNEGAEGDTVLVIEIPDDLIKDYEWIEEGKPYREFLIPAELANQYGPPIIDDSL